MARMSDAPLPLFLDCHPATPAPAVRTLEARAVWSADGALRLGYCLRGDIARLRVPDDVAARRADQLWEHTCFEAFVAAAAQTAYREFNFSPSGLWASYAFADYRQRCDADDCDDCGDRSDTSEAPLIATRRYAGRLEVDATIPASALPACRGELRIALCAVVEAADTVDGGHSYWALRHPLAHPDFHHRDGFALTLSAAPAAR